MKTIEVDEDLYRYIAGQTQHIGESASDILRRLLNLDGQLQEAEAAPVVEKPQGIVVSKDAGKTELVDVVKEMRSLLISDEFAALNKAIDRFILVLSTLHQLNPEGFAQATNVKGRKRVYFANNEETLLANGNTTKPKAIPGTPFWVITNNNTSRKRQMVEQVMAHMGFQSELIEKVTGSI
ncbi:negative regulator of replication initiation SeqA [Vibrio sp. ES.051]|uniref:replication initiation negative regulator SeqA n=1 Tax=Vibrio sp. ES.051 TaxID=1761909 RepID=UPI000BF3FB2B|nr:replication initiation negative regulator SeqA [Vibrio sp. ES.051]PFG46035.1 negative regulator of replication initiation SeqA [Vibrio sp. ES.051]